MEGEEREGSVRAKVACALGICLREKLKIVCEEVCSVWVKHPGK